MDIMAISGQSKWLHWVSNFQTGWPTKGIDLRTLNTIYGTPTSTPANQKTPITEMRNILESNIMLEIFDVKLQFPKKKIIVSFFNKDLFPRV